MKAGRKNLQRACEDGTAVTLVEGESIMQVVTLRGSNLIEVRALLQHPTPHLSLNPFVSQRISHSAAVLCLLLGHGRQGRQVPSLVPGQVPEELLDQER